MSNPITKNYMSKVNIKNNTKFSDLEVLELVLQAVKVGKLARDGKSYCTLTKTFQEVEISLELFDCTQVFTVNEY